MKHPLSDFNSRSEGPKQRALQAIVDTLSPGDTRKFMACLVGSLSMVIDEEDWQACLEFALRLLRDPSIGSTISRAMRAAKGGAA